MWVGWAGCVGTPTSPSTFLRVSRTGTITRYFEEDDKYKRAETFASDILLMCQNCVLFNSRDAKSGKFVRMAKLMWRKFVKTLTMLMRQEHIVFTQPAMLEEEGKTFTELTELTGLEYPSVHVLEHTL